MESAAQRRANLKYRKAHTKQITFAFYPRDMTLWDHLQQQPNKTAYVKELIRRDMAEKNI